MNAENSLPAARAASDDLDEIVYRISHDLRASVRALRDLPCWLREDLEERGVSLDGESKGILDLIHSHSRRLDEMLNGMLAYSRVGRLQELVVIQPQDVFRTVLAALAPPSNVAFFTQFNPVRVRMGDSDLAKIFQILLSNALTHGASEAPRIEVASCQSGGHWELMISDDGPGIAPEHRDGVRRPMVKLVSRDEDEGGGMGLAILDKIAAYYGGTLHIESRRRRGGVTFRVRLPVLA